MRLWSAHRSEHHETIDEEPFEDEAESYDDWAARVREEFEKGSERFEHVDLETAEPSYRDRPLREFRERFPGKYIEPWEISTPTEEFCSPERFVAEINPKYMQSQEFQTNCCDCARSVERTWRGHRETAAGMSGRGGEWRERMESWAGETYRSVGVAEIRERLAAAGHGSSGIVCGTFISTSETGETGPRHGHHAFNVINDGGKIKAVDGQAAMAEPWSDRTGHPHPELLDVVDEYGRRGRLMAMGWDARGRSLW